VHARTAGLLACIVGTSGSFVWVGTTFGTLVRRWSAGFSLHRQARSVAARTTGGTLRRRRLRCTVRWSNSASRRARRDPTISGAG